MTQRELTPQQREHAAGIAWAKAWRARNVCAEHRLLFTLCPCPARGEFRDHRGADPEARVRPSDVVQSVEVGALRTGQASTGTSYKETDAGLLTGDDLILRKIEVRADRLCRLTDLGVPGSIVSSACRLLHDAVDDAESRWGTRQ